MTLLRILFVAWLTPLVLFYDLFELLVIAPLDGKKADLTLPRMWRWATTGSED